MERRLSLLLALLLGGLLFLAGNALARQHAPGAPAAGPPVANQVPDLSPRSSRRISIPYGFADNLPLTAGETITASGHGSCTAGQDVTVEVTITQKVTAAVGYGQTEFPCAGEAVLQTWEVIVTADPYSTFVDGPATACGRATTRDAGGIVQGEPYEWCKEVVLNWPVYLPALHG